MNVIGIVGSPRKNGNTSIVVQEVLKGAAEAGAATRIFMLNEMIYQGCQACNYCKTHEKCKLEDDLAMLFEEMGKADGIVFGAPIYFSQFSGQMRLFLDRTYSLVNPDHTSRLPAGKKAIIVGAQGYPDASFFARVYNEFGEQLTRFFGMDVKEILVVAGYQEPNSIKGDNELMEKARNAGFNLLK